MLATEQIGKLVYQMTMAVCSLLGKGMTAGWGEVALPLEIEACTIRHQSESELVEVMAILG